jgi:hypothetical protein
MNMQEKESKTKHHFYISLVKSFVRVGAGAVLISGNYVLAGILFILAEILGVVEEF